jgi:hypothetical protein
MTKLQWAQIDNYHCRSNEGGYTVCLVHVFGTIWYEAWRGSVFLQRAEDSDSKAMRAVCQAHWDQQQKSQEKAA